MGTATQAFSNVCIRRIFRSPTTACQVGPTQARFSPFFAEKSIPTSPYTMFARASFDNPIVGGFHPSLRRAGITVVQPPAVVGVERIG